MTAKPKQEKSLQAATVRLKSLHIRDYKGIDELEIPFLNPKLPGDTLVTVIGSENGLGKTSILECCALLFLAMLERNELDHPWWMMDFMRNADIFFDPFELMVRSGAKFAKIKGTFIYEDEEFGVSLSCGQGKISVEPHGHFPMFDAISRHHKPSKYREYWAGQLLSLLGVSGEPMIAPPFLYFNSYRKVQEGNMELGMMLSGEKRRYGPDRLSPLSSFKIEIIRALMGRQGVFESVDEQESQDALEKLNNLIGEYANGSISKLREFEERAVELRIIPKSSKVSYPFDGLSSGQKEIISTLFLIWKYTRKQPGIVLLDEPELHLNAEWHRGFVRQLSILQPHNQYVIATHSEHIFDSVDEKNRLLLKSSKK